MVVALLHRHCADREDSTYEQSFETMVDSGQYAGRRLERHGNAVMVVDALSRLPSEMREVLILRHLEHHGFDDIARRMGLPLQAVKKLWRRGLVELRNQVFGDEFG